MIIVEPGLEKIANLGLIVIINIANEIFMFTYFIHIRSIYEKM